MPLRSRLARLSLVCAAVACAVPVTPAFSQAAPLPPSAAASGVRNSDLDAELFYQLFVAEVELRRGEVSTAYQLIIEAARRTGDEPLFRRAVDIAVRARAGEQAVQAAKAWRAALPKSAEAAQTLAQIQLALGKPKEAADPLRSLIELTNPADRPGLIASTPRLLQPGDQAKAGAEMLDDVLAPYRKQAATRLPATVATARGYAIAGDSARALSLANDAQKLDATAEGPALIGLELLKQPDGEALVKRYLDAPGTNAARSNVIRMAYARRLSADQRYEDARTQLQAVTSADPKMATAWLTLGALQIELGQPKDAQASLEKFLAVKTAGDDTGPAAANLQDDDDRADEAATQAYLMLSQAAEQQGDLKAAQSWLDKIADGQGSATVVARRASLLVRQGRVAEARALVHTLPERNPDEARAKILTESQVLREARQWQAAYALLDDANKRFPDDPDLLYEQAMMAEKLDRLDDMEQELRKVIKLRPQYQHAYNALGYSFAERGVRLDEARALIRKALELAPGDPFITDSMGWVEFKLGHLDEAQKLLHEAYAKRPDPEIAAHLGEVLWAMSRRDEAKRVWREGTARDSSNDVLKETLARLKVTL